MTEMAETDLSDWLPVVEAANTIGCSKRTLERRFREWHIEQRLRPQKGSPAVAVYNPDDVARKASEKRAAPAPFVLPADSTGHGNGTGQRALVEQKKFQTGTFSVPAGEDLIRGLALLISKALQSPPSPPVAETVAETPWVDIPTAALILGRSQAYVRRQIKDGALHAERDRRVVVRRKDLEAL